MDNRVFNVNGTGDKQLLATVELVFMQEGDRTFCKSWIHDKEKGLILLWSIENKTNPLPVPLSAMECLPMISAWLKSDEAKTVRLSGWDAAVDHDGEDGQGWRVYCEDWGHVGNFTSAICAITPAVMWYGK